MLLVVGPSVNSGARTGGLLVDGPKTKKVEGPIVYPVDPGVGLDVCPVELLVEGLSVSPAVTPVV